VSPVLMWNPASWWSVFDGGSIPIKHRRAKPVVAPSMCVIESARAVDITPPPNTLTPDHFRSTLMHYR
jgi:hypothetical protein